MRYIHQAYGLFGDQRHSLLLLSKIPVQEIGADYVPEMDRVSSSSAPVDSQASPSLDEPVAKPDYVLVQNLLAWRHHPCLAHTLTSATLLMVLILTASRGKTARTLLIRLSAVDYIESEEAWKIEDSVKLAAILKDNGVDMITASAGGFVFLDKSHVFPSYQLPFAMQIKAATAIVTGTVGMITDAEQANEIITSGAADLVVIAKEFLRDPYFALNAAKKLGQETTIPVPYVRAF